MVGVILAGGRSRRMGRDKATLPFHGSTFLRHTAEVVRPLVSQLLVVTNRPELHAVEGATMVADPREHEGPLVALGYALPHIGSSHFVLFACDMPFLSREVITALLETSRQYPDRAVVVRSSRGLEPLCAVYGTSIRSTVETMLGEGETSMQELLRRLPVHELQWNDMDVKNVNTPEEYRAL